MKSRFPHLTLGFAAVVVAASVAPVQAGNTLLATETVAGLSSVGTFFGFTSMVPITKVVVYDGFKFSGYDGVDNIAFGAALPAVPEPGCVALLGGLLLTGTTLLRRRR